jgi:LysR family glycine cleavage system transcriptional activator
MSPSLHALRVFESVARLEHLGAAAAELHVTPGAVSQQLRSLQLQLGVDLFEKRGRRIGLTKEGAELQRTVGSAMGEITEAIRRLAKRPVVAKPDTVLHVRIPLGLGIWFIPRMFQFMEQHPGVRFEVFGEVSSIPVDWRKVDLAIVYGNPPWEGFWWRMLHGIELRPVCSPQLLRGPHAIRQPQDLVHHRLLHEDDGSEWRRWLLQARVPFPGDADVYFRNFGLVVQAARAGYGVALVDEVISSSDLDEGRLVQPLALSVPAAQNYHCICNEEDLKQPLIGAFVDWLIDQASEVTPPRPRPKAFLHSA